MKSAYTDSNDNQPNLDDFDPDKTESSKDQQSKHDLKPELIKELD